MNKSRTQINIDIPTYCEGRHKKLSLVGKIDTIFIFVIITQLGLVSTTFVSLLAWRFDKG